jgi:hypothetical protein
MMKNPKPIPPFAAEIIEEDRARQALISYGIPADQASLNGTLIESLLLTALRALWKKNARIYHARGTGPTYVELRKDSSFESAKHYRIRDGLKRLREKGLLIQVHRGLYVPAPEEK